MPASPKVSLKLTSWNKFGIWLKDVTKDPVSFSFTTLPSAVSTSSKKAGSYGQKMVVNNSSSYTLSRQRQREEIEIVQTF